MVYQFTPYALPLIAATLLCLSVAAYAWRHRGVGGARALAVLCLAAAQWAFGYSLEILGADFATRVFWGKTQYFGIVGVPLAWLAFSLCYTGRGHRLTPPLLAALLVIPLATQPIIWTTESHGWLWRTISLDNAGPFPALHLVYGPWFWVVWISANVQLALGTVFLIRHARRQQRLYSRQVALVIFAAVIPWISNIAYVLRLLPVPNLDLTPFAFAVAALALAVDIFRYRFLDVVPVARQAVLDSMTDGVLVLDVHGRVADLNPSARRMLGWPSADGVGRAADEALAHWPQLLDFVQHQADGRTELMYLIAPGATRWYDVQLTSLAEAREPASGRLVVLRDITDRKQVEKELALARDRAVEMSTLKTQLLSKVSHELRTPLGSILGFADLIRRGTYGEVEERQLHAAERIAHNAKFLREMVDALIDQAELEAGSVQLAGRYFTPQELLDNVRAQWGEQAVAKGLRLVTEVDPQLPAKLSGDVTRLHQLLANLVSNAVRFTESGAVSVRLFRPAKIQWAMQVSDTGPGIPPEAQTLIFEPFWQMDKSLTGQKGPGLGLSIVKQLTTLMGGQITLESEVGRGSTFTVTLPLYGTS
jgi:PAS domain S-box-containing protein